MITILLISGVIMLKLCFITLTIFFHFEAYSCIRLSSFKVRKKPITSTLSTFKYRKIREKLNNHLAKLNTLFNSEQTMVLSEEAIGICDPNMLFAAENNIIYMCEETVKQWGKANLNDLLFILTHEFSHNIMIGWASEEETVEEFKILRGLRIDNKTFKRIASELLHENIDFIAVKAMKFLKVEQPSNPLGILHDVVADFYMSIIEMPLEWRKKEREYFLEVTREREQHIKAAYSLDLSDWSLFHRNGTIETDIYLKNFFRNIYKPEKNNLFKEVFESSYSLDSEEPIAKSFEVKFWSHKKFSKKES